MSEPKARLGDPSESVEEHDIEITLRPRSFAEFVGQSSAKEQLQIFVQAARNRGDTLDHVLLAGPPGLGKTTLAGIIAAELGVSMHTTSGPAMERKVDVAGLLTNLQKGDVLFVDEIHRLNAAVEEVLYPAMEDYEIDIMIGEGPAARSIRMGVPPFTLIGATTRTGLLTTPLRDRFGVWQRLEYYDEAELAAIVRRSAGILTTPIDDESAVEIARRSRGTPRVANRLLRRVRDFAEVRHQGIITHTICLDALRALPGRRTTAWTSSTATSCTPSATSSTAGRSGWTRSPWRSAKSRTHCRTSTSPTSSCAVSSCARRAAARSPRRASVTAARSRQRDRPRSSGKLVAGTRSGLPTRYWQPATTDGPRP